MSNYQKFDTSVIRTRIKDGTYPTLVGANRAIGKTQGLSDDDKLSLKKYAAKHFGVETPAAGAPKKKAGKKAAKKSSKKAAGKATPKAAKKSAKKVAKKAAAKRAPKAAAAPATEAEPAPASTEAAEPAKVVKKAPAKAKVVAEARQLELPLQGDKLAPAVDKSTATAALMGNVIGTCAQMVNSIQIANALIPKDEATEGCKVVTQVMTRAVRVLDQAVVSPLLEDEKRSVTAAPVVKGKKNPPPKPRNPAPTAKAAVEEEAEEDGIDLSTLSGVDEEELPPVPELTPEEQMEADAMREHMPKVLPASLRVPGVNSAR